MNKRNGKHKIVKYFRPQPTPYLQFTLFAMMALLASAPEALAQSSSNAETTSSEDNHFISRQGTTSAQLSPVQFSQARTFEDAENARLKAKWLAILDKMPSDGTGSSLKTGALREAILSNDLYAATMMAIADSEETHSSTLMYSSLITVMADDTADLGRELLVMLTEDGIDPAKISKAHDSLNVWLSVYGKLIYGYGTDGLAAKTFAEAGAHHVGQTPAPANVESNGSSRASNGTIATASSRDIHLAPQSSANQSTNRLFRVIPNNNNTSNGLPTDTSSTGQAGESPIAGSGNGVSYSSGGGTTATSPDRPILYVTTSTNGIADSIPAIVNGKWQLVNNPASPRWSEGTQGYNGPGVGGGSPIGYIIDGDQAESEDSPELAEMRANLADIKANISTQLTRDSTANTPTGIGLAQIYDGYSVSPGQGGSTVMNVTSTQVQVPTSVMTMPTTQVDVPSTQVNVPSPVMSSLDLYPALCGA